MNFSEWLCIHVCGPAEKAFLWHAVTVLGHQRQGVEERLKQKCFGEKVVAPFFPAFFAYDVMYKPPFRLDSPSLG